MRHVQQTYSLLGTLKGPEADRLPCPRRCL